VSHGITGSSTEKPADIERAEHTSAGLESSETARPGSQSAGLGSQSPGLGVRGGPGSQGAGTGMGGFGFGGPAGGLGYIPAVGVQEDEEPMDIAELPTSFGQRSIPASFLLFGQVADAWGHFLTSYTASRCPIVIVAWWVTPC